MVKSPTTGLKKGMTLVEVLITIMILTFVVLSLLQSFVYFSILASASGNLAAVTAKAQSKMEEIRDHNFVDIPTDFGEGGTPGNVFFLTRANDGVDASGVIYLDTVHSGLLQVTIVVSWRNKDGRIIGGDNGGGDATKALNGVWNTGEPSDSNGRLVSPVLTLVSYVAQRS